MKKQTGIWIDGSKAILVALTNGKEMILEIESGIEDRVHHSQEGDKGTFMGPHHLNQEKKFEERKKHEIDRFLDKIIAEVKDDDELFIMGPAELKLRLKSRISEDHRLAAKLKDVLPADSMTLNQCIEKVKDFYAKN